MDGRGFVLRAVGVPDWRNPDGRPRIGFLFSNVLYIRRFFRIIPIYYLWIFLYIALVSLFGARIQARSFSGKALPLGFGIYAHFLFIQDFVPANWSALSGFWGSWFSHLWSLAVEEQFYLFAPLTVWWLSPRRLPAVLAGIICATPFLRIALLLRVHQIDITHIMPARADSLAMGALAAAAWRSPAGKAWLRGNIRSIYWAAGLFLAGFALLWRYDPSSESFGVASFGFTWIAIFYALLVLIVLAASTGWLAGAMRVRWLRDVGRVSYCMYVIHLIVDLFLHAVFLHSRPRITTWQGAGVSLLAAVATYMLSRLSWAVFEGPLVRIGHRFRYAVPADSRVALLAVK